MKDRILIIGATGSVGFEVAKRLNKLKLPVKIAVRNPERARSINLKEAEFTQFDYSNPATFEQAFTNVDKVLLVSPPSYLRIQDKVIDALNYAKKHGVKLIVNISAISIESKLDRPMKEIENHIKESGIDSVFLRPNCYMQNFKDLFRDLIVADNQITVPADNAKICFVDVRDVAEVAVKALTDDELRNKTYRLTGKQSLNMHVVAHLFSEGLNREIDYISISDEDFEKSLRSAGWPASTIEGTMQLCSHVKSGETSVISDDITTLLGREPIKFEQFIHDYSDNWS
jgi:uncharacterized protein YbjT (DUF2867 family)